MLSFSFNFISNSSKLEDFCKFVISNNKSFLSQNLESWVEGSIYSGFEIRSDFDYRTLKIKFSSVRALKCYLNEKNLIHGRVMATISKFSPVFETYFNLVN